MEDPASYSLPTKTSQHIESNTLPPINGLQMQNPASYMPNMAYPNGNSHSGTGSVPGSMPQTPITPHTPVQHPSSAPPEGSSYAQGGPAAQSQQGPPRALHPPTNSYSAQQANPSSIPQSLQPGQVPQHYAMPSGNPILPRPMQNAPGSSHLASLMTPGYMAQREPEPTHVVGQQGRRGILPSAAGRPTPNGKMNIPPKNEEGKFPCPHCTKTYLHAKHLKRHMLRHTGDRPYQCKLCKDTFSRSDILKRHFQKCSIRRGHTGDQNHLEGSRNHLKNRATEMSNATPGYMNGMPTTSAPYETMGSAAAYITGMAGYNGQEQFGGALDQQNLSNRSSRSGSMVARPDAYSGVSMPGMPQLPHAMSLPQQAPSHYAAAGSAYGYPVTSADMGSAGRAPTVTANGMGQPGMSWNGQYQSQAPAQQYGNVSYDHQPATDGDVKPEPGMMDNQGNSNYPTQNHMYSSTSSMPSNTVFDGWNLGDPFDAKAAALVAYCFADGLPRTRSELLAMDQLKVILTATNIKRYLQFFRDNWNEHWPTIHMPTFSTLEANNGLLLAMMCVGAIYSNEMGLDMERWLMFLIRQAVERNFESIKIASGQVVERSGFEYSSSLIQEVEALTLLQSMFIWHGTAEHRQQAREDYRLLVSIVRKCRLTEPVPLGQQGYSMLHQSHQHQANIDLTKWEWSAWTQQEERSRVMLQIYLIDCALAMFFNSPPQLSPNEVQIQLPADDAAWDATSAEACMNALGMNGDDAQNLCNVSGSKRLSQPEFHLCMQLLFSSQSEFAPRTTNIYSKFLLIHALHAQIWNLQNQSLTQGQSGLGIGSLPSTPLSQHDWVSSAGSYNASNPSSGRATPTESFPNADPHQVNALRFALEKWKRAWETDIDIQYPPTGSPSAVAGMSPRRIGFCRDAVHYYWLAKQFLSSPRTFNWQAYSQPDQRMGFVMGVLKQIRTYVAKEGYRLGKELGSVVEIKEDYAVDMTKLNMRDLFVTLPGAKS